MKDFTLLHKELLFSTARSGGSGGQHVNKVETKVILYFNVNESHYLTEDQKRVLLIKLSKFITKDGVMVMSHDRNRTQLSNKKALLKKFDAHLAKALTKKKKRIPSKPSEASIAKKRKEKIKKSELKSLRKKPSIND